MEPSSVRLGLSIESAQTQSSTTDSMKSLLFTAQGSKPQSADIVTPQIVKSRRRCPNAFPIREANYKIAIVGEAPGEDEENHGYPFVGASGRFLNLLLHDAGIDRHACFVGNVCQYRPPQNKIGIFSWDGEEIQSGLSQLTEDIKTYDPHICLILGNTPLRAALGPGHKITDLRGSLFIGPNFNTPFFTRKCIASLHPAAVLREYSGKPLLDADLRRALVEGSSPTLVLPSRELPTNLPPDELCRIMDEWPSGVRCFLDIEGGLPEHAIHRDYLPEARKHNRIGWPCVSLCKEPSRSVTIVWSKFTLDEHLRVYRSFARLMFRKDVPKGLQNGLYDNFVLSFGYGIPIRGVSEDTMIKGWEIYAELPRSLGVQTSIWTREPFYKSDRKNPDREVFYRYCGKDSAVTCEISNAQDAYFSSGETEAERQMLRSGERHYRKMVELTNPFLYMEVRGIKYDQPNVTRLLHEINSTWIDNLPGFNPTAEAINRLAGKDLRGKIAISQQKLSKFLYEEKGYPPQYEKDPDAPLGKRLTTNIEALLQLKKLRPHDEILGHLIRHRHLEKVRSTLQITADSDGRVRCGYSLEAETGRVKCYTAPTGSGANLQTIQKLLRENYIADPGCDFFECDLEGADGWTVAARCAGLGDYTMLDDYLAGMKPAKLIALLYHLGGDFNKLPRDVVKWYHDKCFPIVQKIHGKWIYLGSKRVQHGTNYLMGIPTMQLNVLKDSFKEDGVPVYLEFSQAKDLQGFYKTRYCGIELWQNWSRQHLIAYGSLSAASGRTRLFFGRRDKDPELRETLKQFLAHEPQDNTTWATNMAMLNLWKDPDNRVAKVFPYGIATAKDTFLPFGTFTVPRVYQPGDLVIEPLHQVHDALCGQWPQFCRDWARGKVKSYFNNEFTIANIKIRIPFDGKFGPSWGRHSTPL